MDTEETNDKSLNWWKTGFAEWELSKDTVSSATSYKFKLWKIKSFNEFEKN